VFAGAEEPVTVVAAKRELQLLVDPLAQAFKRLARALMVGAGDVPLDAKEGPGLVPAVMSARAEAVATAFWKPTALVDVDPRLAPAERNCESAYADATVVTSFTTNWLDALI